MSFTMSGVRPGRFAGRAVPAALLIATGSVFAAQGVWIPAKAALAQVLMERAFSEAVASGRSKKPWPWLDTAPVARISVPRLGANDIALEGASGQALAFGPAHVSGTPEAGETGTAVYAAHRDTQFAYLDALRIGDTIEIERLDRVRLAFRMTGKRVRPWNASGIDRNAPGRHLVLTTCWPVNAVVSGPMRLLVEAELVGRLDPGRDAAPPSLERDAPGHDDESDSRHEDQQDR